jgi:pimeloyl-ACP methyl ester carboxylesterase
MWDCGEVTGVDVRLPSLHYEVHGQGEPLLLIHGAGEDATILDPLAEALANAGFGAIAYDRRGTGRSSRSGWPGDDISRHVADAADLIVNVARQPTTVLGLSSGGLLALELAVRRPDLVTEAIAWEPPAVAVLEGADELHAMLMAPVEAYLADHPGDWSGAYNVMLGSISGGQADLADPRVTAMRRNAEAAVRDDAQVITRHQLDLAQLASAPAVLAIGERPNELHAKVVKELAARSGLPVWQVSGADDHEIYLDRPEVLAEALKSRRSFLQT